MKCYNSLIKDDGCSSIYWIQYALHKQDVHNFQEDKQLRYAIRASMNMFPFRVYTIYELGYYM